MVRGLGDLPQGGGSAGGAPPQDCKSQILGCWDSVPFWNRVVFTTSIGLYAATWLWGPLAFLLVCTPMEVIFHLQVWRLFTGFLMHAQFLNLLFSVFSYIPTAMQIEGDIGTVRFTYRFWLYGFFTEVLFTVVVGLLYVGGMQEFAMKQMSAGLWPLLFCDLVIQCMQEPEASMGLCCLPIQVQAKWYPPILLGLFCLFFGFDLSFFAGMAIGYIHAFGYLNRFQMSVPKAAEWETKFPFKNWSEKPSFAKTGDGMAGEILPTSQSNSSGFPMPGQPSSAQPSAGSFSAFSGKGKSIGGAATSAPEPVVPTSISSADTQSSEQERSEAATRNIAQQSILLQQIQEKRRQQAAKKDSADKGEEAKTEDYDEEQGHSMAPDDLKEQAKASQESKYLIVAGDSVEEE